MRKNRKNNLQKKIDTRKKENLAENFGKKLFKKIFFFDTKKSEISRNFREKVADFFEYSSRIKNYLQLRDYPCF